MMELPPELEVRLREFLERKKTGSLSLDIKDGVIVRFQITESGRLDKNHKYPIR